MFPSAPSLIGCLLALFDPPPDTEMVGGSVQQSTIITGGCNVSRLKTTLCAVLFLAGAGGCDMGSTSSSAAAPKPKPVKLTEVKTPAAQPCVKCPSPQP